MKEHGLSSWQLTMMALGTVIGGSFFLGSAVPIRAAGPAVIISFLLGGALVYVILFALSEMTVTDPAPGSFRAFAEKAFGPMAGFIVGWLYWTGLVLAMSSEATAVSIILRNWFAVISLPVLGYMVIIGVSLANLLGADKLSKLESGLALVKLLAIVGFIVTGLALIGGLLPGTAGIGSGALEGEALLPSGFSGIAGSMLLVIFAYAGFEIIGLAASEAAEPHRTVPRAIAYTVISLVGLYVFAIAVLLPLAPTNNLTTAESPLVTALVRWNLTWAGNLVNIVLVTAILSTMLAAMFGLGRMLRSLADEGHAPHWFRDQGDIPYRGILISGAAMLAALALGLILPQQLYLFLISSGGFALLFSYVVILMTHYKLRKRNGCPPKGNCQLPGFPLTSWLAIAGSLLIIVSMPLVPGQGAGLAMGVILLLLFYGSYRIKTAYLQRHIHSGTGAEGGKVINGWEFGVESSEELTLNKADAKDGHRKNRLRRQR